MIGITCCVVGSFLQDDLEKFKAEHPEVEVGAKKSILSKDEKHLKEK